MVAADQRQTERARDQRPGDARAGPGEQTWIASKPPSARVCTAAGRLGHADAQAGVEGHVDLGDGGQAPVDLGVGAEHLDLKAGDAALADLLDRARDAVGGADAVGEDRNPRRLAVLAPRSPARGRSGRRGGDRRELRLLVGQEGGGGRVGDGGDARLEQPSAAASSSAVAGGGAHGDRDRRPQLALVQRGRRGGRGRRG